MMISVDNKKYPSNFETQFTYKYQGKFIINIIFIIVMNMFFSLHFGGIFNISSE